MKKLKNNINKLALREEVKAIKIGIGAFIGVYLTTLIGNTKATTMSTTVFIILIMYPTSSSSRAYFKQRVFANIYGLLVTLIVGEIFDYSSYSLPVVYFCIVLFYQVFKLKGKISLVSSGVGAMMFFMTASDSSSIEARFLSIVIGGIVAILVNELILPINYGLITENTILTFSKNIFKMENLIIGDKVEIKGEDYKTLEATLQKIHGSLAILEKDMNVASKKTHIKTYKNKLSSFKIIFML